jgi:hypothetical protein
MSNLFNKVSILVKHMGPCIDTKSDKTIRTNSVVPTSSVAKPTLCPLCKNNYELLHNYQKENYCCSDCLDNMAIRRTKSSISKPALCTLCNDNYGFLRHYQKDIYCCSDCHAIKVKDQRIF